MEKNCRAGKPNYKCSGRSFFVVEGRWATALRGCKNHAAHRPFLKITLLVLAILCSGMGSLSTAQDILFRKSGENIEAYSLTTSGKSRSYRLKDDPEMVRRYISISSLDSIRYADGRKDIFNFPEIIPEKPDQDEAAPFDRNYLLIDVAALPIYKNLKFSYEHLMGKGFVGLFGTFAVNFDPIKPDIWEGYEYGYEFQFYDPMARVMTWNFRAGANFYIFKPGYFRLAAGLSWITGAYNYTKSAPLDHDPWVTTTEHKNEPVNGLLFSPGLHYQPESFIQFRLGLDIPVIVNPDFNMSMLTLEAALNF
ncbi:hypothetical protein BA6E_12112 [Bacteroidales bacterium 6E]|nr:hypothetical protein BA6E_12112 [Bacteroidales bacterium 6E]